MDVLLDTIRELGKTMTMNKIMAKLRKNSKGRIHSVSVFSPAPVRTHGVRLCVFILFSPRYRNSCQPAEIQENCHGCSFFVTAAGCTIFTIYGADLFFKNKSREFGVFLALGEQKRKLEAQLFREVALILLKYVCFSESFLPYPFPG